VICIGFLCFSSNTLAAECVIDNPYHRYCVSPARSSNTNCRPRKRLCHDLAAILDARKWVSDKAARVQHTRCGFCGPVRLVRGRRHPCTSRHHFSIATIMGSVCSEVCHPVRDAWSQITGTDASNCCDAAIRAATMSTMRRQVPCRMSCKLMCSDSDPALTLSR